MPQCLDLRAFGGGFFGSAQSPGFEGVVPGRIKDRASGVFRFFEGAEEVGQGLVQSGDLLSIAGGRCEVVSFAWIVLQIVEFVGEVEFSGGVVANEFHASVEDATGIAILEELQGFCEG